MSVCEERSGNRRYNLMVLRPLFETFARDCARRIASNGRLSDVEAAAFSRWLEFKECEGRPLLGSMAGPDGSIDTVTGRCGHPPVRVRS